MERILGNRLESNGGPLQTTSVNNVKFKCLYVSASWCPPCRTFLPELKDFYHEANKTEKQLEIIWVSRDRTPEDFADFLKEMPWVALPYDRQLIQQVLNHYQVEGMPKLFLLDEFGTTIYDSCRTDINVKGLQCLSEWEEMLNG